MDLNELYFRYQLSTMRADGTDDLGQRRYHRSLADGFGRRIAAIQQGSGAAAARGWACAA
ncbi:hypothetical protein ACOYW6_02050 [Parablastomonas sp. CN1-191]|uniref:hypothetical protein n=1 Tax=Parablastomonas sp. CN1-191 TaxID=3400908 RepID=UPI003BF813C5